MVKVSSKKALKMLGKYNLLSPSFGSGVRISIESAKRLGIAYKYDKFGKKTIYKAPSLEKKRRNKEKQCTTEL